MHELSMAKGIVETVIAEANKRNAKSVSEVCLVVGKLSMLGLDQLRYCYKLLTKDTILEESKLKIELEEGQVYCERCKFEGPIKIREDPQYHIVYPTLECPECGGEVEVVSGRNCYIKSIKLRQ
ncbi:MAG: hydrogenase maturation nickel metallochaperone HypA [Candidatus Bathyarchaeia archaeon]|nr:hydrogenase maturation nickel metallochaperone HypA [Candidatus Bathyarchaeota archaeon]